MHSFNLLAAFSYDFFLLLSWVPYFHVIELSLPSLSLQIEDFVPLVKSFLALRSLLKRRAIPPLGRVSGRLGGSDIAAL